MIDKRYFRYFDWISFSISLALLILGLLFVFSSTYNPAEPFSIFFKKQFIGIVTGLLIYIFLCCTNINISAKWGYYGFFLLLILLTYTILNGFIGMGAKRWISLYFIKFQPSELTKLLLPMFIAYYFSEEKNPQYDVKYRYIEYKEFTFPLIILLITFILILKQPDLGTALITLITGTIIIWFIGIDKKFFIISALLISIGTPFFWQVLKPYQKQRILVLLGEGDIRKERYQLEQSKIAIGSGGLLGKGFLRGTQNKLSFLPEDHTDFIFSVACEELGFVGALLIILLFGGLFIRLIYVTTQLKTFFEPISYTSPH